MPTLTAEGSHLHVVVHVVGGDDLVEADAVKRERLGQVLQGRAHRDDELQPGRDLQDKTCSSNKGASHVKAWCLSATKLSFSWGGIYRTTHSSNKDTCQSRAEVRGSGVCLRLKQIQPRRDLCTQHIAGPKGQTGLQDVSSSIH